MLGVPDSLADIEILELKLGVCFVLVFFLEKVVLSLDEKELEGVRVGENTEMLKFELSD